MGKGNKASFQRLKKKENQSQAKYRETIFWNESCHTVNYNTNLKLSFDMENREC